MYVYFDKSGRLLEIIDEPIREGSSNSSFIYAYFDNNLTISSWWSIFKKADGNLTTETKIETFENRAIPDNLKRDLKYFEENKTYKFAKITIPDDVLSQDGLALCTIRLILVDSSIFALGEIPFNVEENVVLEMSDITYSQYNYLLSRAEESDVIWSDVETYIGITRQELSSAGSTNYTDYLQREVFHFVFATFESENTRLKSITFNDATYSIKDYDGEIANIKSSYKQKVSAGGMEETGQFLDFHSADTSSDYSTRLQSNGDNQNIVILPTISGTLLAKEDTQKYTISEDGDTLVITENW